MINKERDVLLGCDYEETRVKIRKDKSYFARLENKEIEEKTQTPAEPSKKQDLGLLILPMGLK